MAVPDRRSVLRGAAVAAGVCVALLATLPVALIEQAVYGRLFPTHTVAFRAADRLTTAVFAGPPSPADRTRLPALCDGDEHAAGHRMRVVLPLAVDRNPDWRPTVVAHHTRQAADPTDAGRRAGAGLMRAKLARRPAAP